MVLLVVVRWGQSEDVGHRVLDDGFRRVSSERRRVSVSRFRQ